MNTYNIIHLNIANPIYNDILIAELTQHQYEGFEEVENGIKAYVELHTYDEAVIQQLIKQYATQTEIALLSVEKMEPQNWNQVWESNFTPVKVYNTKVNKSVVVKAPFHEVSEPFDYTIHIEPEMAFGTGHHETTTLMMEQMLALSFQNKKVLDFGCGTGILAILASHLQAQDITAIDYDPLSYENTLKNIAVNQMTNIQTLLGDASAIPKQTYAIILANINYHVIRNSLSLLHQLLAGDGHLLVSGILIEDKETVIEKAVALGFQLMEQDWKEEWSVIVFGKGS